jgi:hypothetical protein
VDAASAGTGASASITSPASRLFAEPMALKIAPGAVGSRRCGIS